MNRSHIHIPASLGDRMADRVAAILGSWRGLGVMTLFILVWISLNVSALVRHWDPYPFILLNLVFSTQAFYAAPIILMSQNRAAARDHARDELEAEEVSLLLHINRQQTAILEKLDPDKPVPHTFTRTGSAMAGRLEDYQAPAIPGALTPSTMPAEEA
ncbi:MAG TPA: DUF1003 domain-containing protein [Chloroflexota bacterium]|nr:DUF1003 domain-containing protein [Chloroflexota bacterium]